MANLQKIVSLQKKQFNMEEKFTRKEQETIASVLLALIKTDYRVLNHESQTLQECLDELGFHDESFQPYSKRELRLKAEEYLKPMSKDKKRVFSRMMTKIARSDGDFGPLERAFAVEILEMCDIPFIHR